MEKFYGTRIDTLLNGFNIGKLTRKATYNTKLYGSATRMKTALTLLVALLAVGCNSPSEDNIAAPMGPGHEEARNLATDTRINTMTPTLSEALEAELAAIASNPQASVGFGLKAYLPYEPNGSRGLMNSDDPAVTTRLLAQARGTGDTVYRLAVLHVLGKRTDANVDAALIQLLADDALRASAAYLLGRAGYKGYPPRARDIPAVQAALRAHIDDSTPFTDPFYQQTYRRQDFVIAAYIRVTGPSQFTFATPAMEDLIGLGLPSLSNNDRADLLAQIKQMTP